MKNLLMSFFLFAFSLQIFAQEKLLNTLPLKEGKITYSDVVPVDGVSKDELYKRAKRWFIETYKSGKDVIQLDDKDNGEIIGKGFYSDTWMATFYAGQSVNIWKTIRVMVKDGRFKYEISDFRIKYFVAASQYTSATDVDMPLEDWNKGRESNSQKFFSKVDTRINDLVESLKKAMTAPGKASEDW